MNEQQLATTTPAEETPKQEEPEHSIEELNSFRYCHKFLVRFLKHGEFGVLRQHAEDLPDTVHSLKEQLKQLEIMGDVFRAMQDNAVIETLSIGLFWHDIANPITLASTYPGYLIEDIERSENDGTELDREKLLSTLEIVQENLEKLIKILNGIDPETGDIKISPQNIGELVGYVSKVLTEAIRKKKEAKNKPTTLTMDEKLTFFLAGELENEQVNILKAKFPHAIYEHVVEHSFTAQERKELQVAIDSNAFVRTYENAYSNALKAYLVLLERSLYREDIDPVVKVTTKETANGLFIIIEDEATGFPTKGSRLAISKFDRSLCLEYDPKWKRSLWGNNEKKSKVVTGTGTGLAGLASKFYSLNHNKLGDMRNMGKVTFRCFTLLDANNQPRGSRIEIFAPYTIKKKTLQPAQAAEAVS